MLFSSDFWDVLCEVELFCMAPGDVVETPLFSAIKDRSPILIFDEVDLEYFFIKVSMSEHLYLEHYEPAVRWLINQLFHHVKVNRTSVDYDNLSKALVKLDYREFITHCIDTGYMVTVRALLTYGTVDQVRWAFTDKKFAKRVKLVEVIRHVARLDVMRFISKLKPKLFIGVEVTDIIDLLYYGNDVKRDLDTLEYLMELLGYGSERRRGCLPFPAHFIGSVTHFVNLVTKEGDESLLEWLFINQPKVMKELVNESNVGMEVLYEIATKCSHRIMRLFLDRVYTDNTYVDKRFGDVILNLQYLIERSQK